jgi:hypothetical protein
MEGASTTETSSASAPTNDGGGEGEKVNFTLTFKKQKYDVSWPLDDTIQNLKTHIEKLSGVPVSMQKLMLKGIIKDNSQTLRQVGFTEGAKAMLVGSTISDVVTVNIAPEQAAAAIDSEEKKQEPLCEQTKHKKIIEKGIPENAMKGYAGRNDALPDTPLVGILNNRGTPIRLTFKIWSQEIWISSKTSTQQLPFSTVRSVVSEPIKGHEEYHIMALQLGGRESENSKYFLYWVPAQYTKAIKNSIMGTFL